MRFKDQVVVVTGGGSGIGRSASLKFAGEGAKVVILDLNPESARSTVSQIEQNGGAAMSIPTDVSDEQQVSGAVRRIIEANGTIHALANIAAKINPKTLEAADTILFLASDQSGFITGQAIQIEGGATLGYGAGPKAEWSSISL